MNYKNYAKPVVDFLAAAILFVISLPVFLVVSILLFFINNGNMFFIQERPGKDQKIFRLIKFRTMNELKDKEGNLKPDKERLTKIGSWIRRTSLDELPQLINVISGNMSFIGPRPLLPEYLPLYNEFQQKRHSVKPGITGWAQINGRNAITWGQKFEYDVWYVEHISFLLDLKILFITIMKILKMEGINYAKDIPMEKFKGDTNS